MYGTSLRVVGAVAFVATVGVVAFFVASRFASSDAVSQESRDSSAWTEDLKDHLQPTIEADRSLPPARGSIGDFFVVGMGSADAYPAYPCTPSDEGPIEAEDARIEGSELWFGTLGDSTEAFECTDGTIYGISGTIRDGDKVTEFGHGYYIGDAIVRSEAPAARLEQTMIAGRPALIEHDLDVSPFPSQTRIFVIERASTPEQPGIMLTVYTAASVDRGIEIAEEIIR